MNGSSSLEMLPPPHQSRMLDTARKPLALAQKTIQEIGTFQAAFREKRGNKEVLHSGLQSFIRLLKREEDTLHGLEEELVTSADQGRVESEKLKNMERKIEACACAVGHANLQWSVLKRCGGSFVAMNQAFQGSTKEARREEISRMNNVSDTRGRIMTSQEKQNLHRLLKEQGKVEVDVVASGYEWVVIKTLKMDRLARHMTDVGWDWGVEEGDDLEAVGGWEDIPLAKYVKRVVTAARANRWEFCVPRVRLVLTNIRRGENRDVDVFLGLMEEEMGVKVEDAGSDFMCSAPPPLDIAIENLLGDSFEGLTERVNLDHAILIDLISDLTHMKLEPRTWQASTTRMQIDEENAHEGGLMARTLYPILRGRRLVCTKEAAEHFHDVLRTVGTESERERGRLLVPIPHGGDGGGDDDDDGEDVETVQTRFQQLSIHQLPEDIQLPIDILSEPWTSATIADAIAQGKLPKVAQDVERVSGWSSSKMSIFMFGWAEGIATVTSNREIKGQVKTWVEGWRREDGEMGPKIWRVDVTRNLLAKSATPRDDV